MNLLGAGTTEVKEQRSVSQERGRPHVGCVNDLEGEVKG